jgi:hypothetical protein
MAENGASDRALRGNVEGMYSRSDKKARRAKMELQRLRYLFTSKTNAEQGE